MNKKIGKFKYFPSFSAGEFGHGLLKNHKFKDELTCRFYTEEFPEEFRYTDFLITAGAHKSRKDFYNELGFKRDTNLIMGDSGGYQIASGAIKWKPELKTVVFDWLENNSDIAMNLDIPPRLKYTGKFKECFDISMENFKYFNEKQTGRTKFLNVLQGEDDTTYKEWYTAVKDFDFQGWSIGGTAGDVFRFMASVCTLLEGREHEKKSNEYLHILGTSRIQDFFMLLQLQKSLEDVGSNITVTTDSSTPDRAVVFGLYYTSFSFKDARFEAFNMPREKHLPEMPEMLDKIKTQNLIGVNDFDRFIEKWADMRDVCDWNWDGQFRMRLHNFYLFLDTIELIEQSIYGIRHNLEQMINKDLAQVLRSIDEMVKSDNPRKVFDRYKKLYNKISNVKKSIVVKENNFFG